MSNLSSNFRNNRRRKSQEQINYWRFNIGSGILRLVERLLFRFNTSDILAGDLDQIKHLEEVKNQVISRELVEPALTPNDEKSSGVMSSFESTAPQYLIHLRNSRVDVLTGLVYLDAGFVIDSTLAKWQKILFRGGIGSAIKRSKSAKKKISGAHMILPHTPFYYHAVIDEIPNLLKIRSLHPEINSVIMHSLSEKWAIDLLVKLGFTVVIPDSGALIVEDLFVITAPRALNRKNLDLLRRDINANPNKILIVSRSGAPRSDDSLESAIKASIPEAELVDPGSLSAADQVEIFSQAKVIIGLHGGALTNVVWMHRSGKVIEIFNHAYRTRDYENICVELGQEYASIEATNESFNDVVNEVKVFVRD